ncbi:MAG: zinc ABC transporter substrate-binding protein [Nitrososphaerales archaeon]
MSNRKIGVLTGIAVVAILALVISVNVSRVSEEREIVKQESEIAGSSISAGEKIKVATTFYPLYEFTKNVGGSRVEITTLVPVGIEPHHWEPTPRDIQNLETTDIFVYNGAGFEPWIDRITAKELSNVAAVEIARGIELLQSEDKRKDPHVWLDPILAKHQVNMIKLALTEVDSAHAQYYEENAASYIAKLDALDARIRADLSNCEKDTFVTFHQAFGYFANRYGLKDVHLVGLDPETEVSPEELRALIDFARANDIRVIYAEELVNPRLAEVLAFEVGAQVLILSPVEGLTDEEVRQGLTYIEKMEQNVQNLRVGLDCR